MSVFADIPSDPAEAALEYARRGLAVFPCSPHTKRPLTKHGFLDASADPAQVAAWWAQSPKALIGLPTGERNKLWVLDADAKHGDADELIEEVEMECDTRFRGPRASTLHHGRHVYFAHDPRVRIGAGRFRPGIDWRGEGGYVCAPDGVRYRLIADGDIEPAPEALIFKIVSAQGGGQKSQQTGHAGFSGLRYEPTMREWAEAATREGSRHDGMLRIVWRLVERGLPMDEILALAPLFPQPEHEYRIAVEKAFAKQERPPEGAAAAQAAMFGERLEARPVDQNAINAIKARDWLYGHLAIRQFVSVIGAPGGTGKTAYATTVALAMASGRPLLSEAVHKRCRVWLYNLEDPLEEQYRRLAAAMTLHRVTFDEIKDHLFLASGRDQRLCLAAVTKEQIAALTPHVDMMIAEIKARRIDVAIIDPFVKSHALNENDNQQIDAAATAWAEVAEKAACAPILVHHFRKGSNGDGSADQFRGASALVDAARCAVSLSPMSEQDAERLGAEPNERLRLVRQDNAKLNLAPKAEETPWLELVGVTLPSGDSVQAVRRWEQKSVFYGLTPEQCNQILDRIALGVEDGIPYAADRQAKDRWAGTVVSAYCDGIGVKKTDAQCGEIIRQWIESGALKIIDFKKPDRRWAKGLEVVDKRRPGVQWDVE